MGFLSMTLEPRVHAPWWGKRSKSKTPFKSGFMLFCYKQFMEIVGHTSVNLMTLICVSRCEGQHDLYFTVLWFCLISWRLLDGWTSNFWIMSRCDPAFDLKINVGHSNLYLTVQWFCLISWRLLDGWTSDFWIMDQWPNLWPKNKCRPQWPVILPYFLRLLMNAIPFMSSLKK